MSATAKTSGVDMALPSTEDCRSQVMQTEPGEGMCPHDRRSPRCSAGAREEPELPSVIPRTSQRVTMAGMKQRLQVELEGTEDRPIGEKMRMKIHLPDEENRQKPGMEMAGMK